MSYLYVGMFFSTWSSYIYFLQFLSFIYQTLLIIPMDNNTFTMRRVTWDYRSGSSNLSNL